ncbi:DUF1987 domain-containing protein [Paenibacillus piri]|uniref:DUF1987 domain-containing protein n=1 Tax=Paenibacillus piri TaxID=2547395 RepID=A0A4R5KR79_9BACL|nr:DUF1987 domain-containing protein [Paenibacillus piri]TDF97495.1 DUF1987 domain-containing protein [Paenibacillus piri]
MERLQIQGSRSTPEIDFDAVSNILLVKGQSYPENSFKFYEPVLQWVDDYLLQLTEEEVHVHFNLPYINTSSSKCIMMLLEKLDQAHLAGKTVILNWYYSADNDSELECAEEFKEDMSLPFYILPLEEG